MNKQSDNVSLMRSLDGTKTITVEEFDQLFDDASDEIDNYIDWSGGRTKDEGIQTVSVELSDSFVSRLDAEAARLDITRSVLIRRWIYDRFKAKAD